MQKIFFISASLNVNRGGLTKAVILRANALAAIGYSVTLLTMKYQHNHDGIIQKLRKQGDIDARVDIRNFWADVTSGSLDRQNHLAPPNEVSIDKQRITDDGFIYEFKDGLLHSKQAVGLKGRPGNADFYDAVGRRTETCSFWSEGKKKRSLVYFADGAKIAKERHFDADGRCRISIEYDKSGEDRAVFVWNGPFGEKFASVLDAQRVWVIQNTRGAHAVFDDHRTYDSVLSSLDRSIKKIAVVHMTHLEPPYSDIKQITPDYDRLFQSKGIDCFAMLTPQQIEDAGSIGYQTDRMRVLPNTQLDPARTVPKKIPNLIVVVARYVHQKRLEDVLKVMQRVHAGNSAARLEIYGQGEDKAALTRLRHELGLDGVVSINDYVPAPLDVVSRAQCTLLTSRHEGLGMTMIESLSVGTPIIAYDVKYGPAFVVQDGINGHLVTEGDIETMAGKVLGILSDPAAAATMAKAALASSERFSRNAYQQAWTSVLSG